MNDPELIHDCLEPTSKQKKYVKAVIEGNSKEKAKLIAGYSAKTSTEIIERSPKLANLRAELLEKMEDVGVTSEILARKLKQGLSTKKKQFFSKDGIVTDERTTPDEDIRHKYLRAALEIRGDIKNSAIESLNIGVVQMPSQIEDNSWNDSIDISTQEKPIDSPSETSDKINE